MKKHTFKKLVGIGLASALAMSSLTMMASAAATDFGGDIEILGTVKPITLNMTIPTTEAVLDVYNVDGNGQVYLAADATDETSAIDAAIITSLTVGADVEVSITKFNVDFGTSAIVLSTTPTFTAPTTTKPATKGLYLDLETSKTATAWTTDETGTQGAVRTAMDSDMTVNSFKALTNTPTAAIALGTLTKNDGVATDPVDAVGFDITGAANTYFSSWVDGDAFTVTITYAVQPVVNVA